MPDQTVPPSNQSVTPKRFSSTETRPASPGDGRSLPVGPPHHLPLWVAWLIVLGGIASLCALLCWARRGAIHAWERFAKQIGGEFRAKNYFSPAVLTGTVRDHPFLLETAMSHEDDAPYYHTRGAVPVRNEAGFVLGIRRKSLLEEAQTRRDVATLALDDPEFERRFFLVTNDPDHLTAVLTAQVQRELSRYPDVEIYARLDVIEWRRAGEQSDLRGLERLTDLLCDMAEAIDALPPQRRSLSQRLADENLIAKGV